MKALSLITIVLILSIAVLIALLQRHRGAAPLNRRHTVSVEIRAIVELHVSRSQRLRQAVRRATDCPLRPRGPIRGALPGRLLASWQGWFDSRFHGNKDH